MRILRSEEELSPRQHSAIELVLRGMSDVEVGAQLGIDRTTVYRWRMSPLFRRELDRQRKMLFEHSAARLSAMVQPALEILNRQLTGDDPRTALRAAAILLRVATPSRLGHIAGSTKKSTTDPEAFPDDDLEEDEEEDVT